MRSTRIPTFSGDRSAALPSSGPGAESPLWAGAFVAVFTGCIVGSKVLIATVVGRSRHMLSGKVYATVMRVLGLMLLVFAALLFRDGLELAGW